MRSIFSDHLIFEQFAKPKREWILKMAEFYDLGWHFDVDNPEHIKLVEQRAREAIRDYKFITSRMATLIDIDKLAKAYDDWTISITSIKKRE